MSANRASAADKGRKPAEKKVRREIQWGSLAGSLLFLAILLAAAFANVWLTEKCRVLTYEISLLEEQVKRERENRRRLEVEVANLKSPQRIERIAVTQLGLKPPTPDQVVRLP